MGTSSEIIIENGTDTKSFYVNFGSHEDDLGLKLQKLLEDTSNVNWKDEFVDKLKKDSKFTSISKTQPVDYIYLINNNKQILYKNRTGWNLLNN